MLKVYCIIKACLGFPASRIIISSILVLLVLITFGVCDKATESKPPDSVDFSDHYAIVNGRLIDGTGSDPIENGVLVIGEGFIVNAGPAGSISIPDGITIIDVSGSTILPGFINTHIHHGFNRSNLRAWAQDGVTTVRDLCGPSAFDYRDELLLDTACARLVAAGPMVSVPGGYPFVPWGNSCMMAVNSPEDAVQKVGNLLDSGADIIKLAIEGGESFGQVIPSLSHDEAVAAVQTAHSYGTVISAHVLVSNDLRRALDAGVDDIAHMVWDNLPVDLIDRMIANGVIWVPTIELGQNVGYNLGDAAINNLRKFVQAGGIVALGTDYAGYNRPFQLGMPINEIFWMLDAGMTPMQVIVSATRNAAIVCNRGDDLGTLEAGKIADVLIVNGNPLEDIQSLTNVRMVIHNGVVIMDENQ
jgi:imidazolonepropionase-like amidohydrolase